MNKRLNVLMKIMPFLSVLFILIGISMAIFGALDHNHKMFMGSLFVIVQAALVITYTKMFKKIGF
ncbi:MULTISPECIES: hypothetical protein [Bacillus]|uniref:Uncharacterized protein n=2 Tax=Bacillus TaxID=1386 RepID=A0A2B6U231_9BACI|nr:MULTISPECIES: hypothetical protein [Bacillus]OUB45550.1 hypothetical protein BK740_11460 [Bacillus thuringiensis serovar argentinensis]EJS66074.1 hypothetical protein ICW_03780 [Bacillus wiedmannii]EJV66839.1 hypothetical protein IEO_01428 [Bacillus wiedmannii]MCU5095373.1 hypothetical protein [Bacillus wiedmannii]MCW1238668.1 hypothetical protein [Bacillus pretiosus]